MLCEARHSKEAAPQPMQCGRSSMGGGALQAVRARGRGRGKTGKREEEGAAAASSRGRGRNAAQTLHRVRDKSEKG